MVRITLTQPKAALAGVMPSTSFAIFMASMAAFNKERAVSGRFGRCDFVSMLSRNWRWMEETAWRASVRDPGTIIWMGGHIVGHHPPHGNGVN